MAHYFYAKELVAAIRYGWDVSFEVPPHPKDAWRNNGSAMQFPEHMCRGFPEDFWMGGMLPPIGEGVMGGFLPDGGK